MVKTLHGTLDRNGAGCTVGEFVLASDYAALEARCRELERCLDGGVDCANERIQQKEHIQALEAALNKAVGAFETIGFHLPKDNLEAVNEAILIARGFNAWYDSTKETKAEPMPVGEHPLGGPCIHVWALTNRSAIRNGKCSICGDTENRGEKP